MNYPTTYVSVQTYSHSGSTLLAFLLGAHPQIVTVGEMNGLDGLKEKINIETFLCSCGQRIAECEFWQSVTTAMHERGFEFDVANFETRFALPGPLLFQTLYNKLLNYKFDLLREAIFGAWPGGVRRLKTLVARNEALINAIVSLTLKPVFVDTSKDRLRFYAMSKWSYLDTRVIHLVRDVRGVTTSHLRRHKVDSAHKTARRWANFNRGIESRLAAFPADKQMMVRYEDLCQDTSGVLKRLFNFCGVDPETQITDFGAVPHHIIGNVMRLRFQSEIKLDERWKSILTAEQLKEIDRFAGDLNRRYGYA